MSGLRPRLGLGSLHLAILILGPDEGYARKGNNNASNPNLEKKGRKCCMYFASVGTNNLIIWTD